MRRSILLLPLAAFLSTTAEGALPRADRDDTVHMSCDPSTRTFVEADFREMMLLRGVKLRNSFCLTGVTLADVRERIASWDERSGNGRKKAVLNPNDVFPPLFDRMYNAQRIGKPEITRARYTAVLVAPHGK